MVELSGTANEECRLGFAGDTFNTAWYLRRCLGSDWRVGFFSRVGTGKFSQGFLNFLGKEGIESFVSCDPEREIGLYAISLERGERNFSYWRDTSAARRLADNGLALRAALEKSSIAYLSGITLAILTESRRQGLLDALESARSQGCMVVFDPNIRSQLWHSEDEIRHWITQAAKNSDLVLPSFDDETALFGDSDPAATCIRYLAAGAEKVVVKNGGGPIWYAAQNFLDSVTDLPREVALDSTAAGDSFNAGLLASLLSGSDLAASIVSAHQLSSRVVLQYGALVSI